MTEVLIPPKKKRGKANPLEETIRKLPKKEREEAELALQTFVRLAERNPLTTVDLTRYRKQHDFLKAHNWLKAFFGGNGAGKTFVGLLDDVIQAIPREYIPPHLLQYKWFEPPFFCRIVCPKWNVVGSILEKLREIVPKDALLHESFDESFNKQEMKLRFKGGSWFVFNTADQDRDAHAAIELHRVHFDEEPPGIKGFGIYTENVNRLRRYAPHAQIMFTMTPLFGLSWTFDEVWERRDDPMVSCIVASMRDNPFIDSEAVIKGLQHLSDQEKEAVIEGKFVSFTGLVIREWKDELNLIPPFAASDLVGQDLIVISIDPGISKAAVTYNAFDQDNNQVVFDEIYPSNEDAHVDQLAKAIRRKNRYWQLKQVLYVIDPSAVNRSLTDGRTVLDFFNKQGIYPIKGENDKESGFLEIKSRTQHGSLKVCSNCENVLYEQKRWTIKRDETMTDRNRVTYETTGPHHTWDTIRYASMYRPFIHRTATVLPRKPVWQPNWAPPYINQSEDSFPLGSMS